MLASTNGGGGHECLQPLLVEAAMNASGGILECL